MVGVIWPELVPLHSIHGHNISYRERATVARLHTHTHTHRECIWHGCATQPPPRVGGAKALGKGPYPPRERLYSCCSLSLSLSLSWLHLTTSLYTCSIYPFTILCVSALLLECRRTDERRNNPNAPPPVLFFPPLHWSVWGALRPSFLPRNSLLASTLVFIYFATHPHHHHHLYIVCIRIVIFVF